jgi:hypothetical protein
MNAGLRLMPRPADARRPCPVAPPRPARDGHREHAASLLDEAERSIHRADTLIEVFFHKLKCFRAIATRYDKTARSYLGLVHLVCAFLSLN